MQINLSIPKWSKEKTISHRGEGWLERQFEPSELISHINQGQAWCVSLLKDGKRNQKHFLSSQLIAIDLDSKENTMEAIEALPFFANFGYAILPSPSWSLSHQRYRVLYILDEKQTDLKRHKELILKVKQAHASLKPDNAPSNPVTLFFGTSKNLDYVRTPAKILPVGEIDKIELIKKKTTTKKAKATVDRGIFSNGNGTTTNGYHKPESGKERLITWIVRKLVEGSADGQKHETMGSIFYMVGGYVAAGSLDMGDVETILSRSGWLSLPWQNPDDVLRQVNNFVDNGRAEPLKERWFDEPPKTVYGIVDDVEFSYTIDGEGVIDRIIRLNEFCQVNGIGCHYDSDLKRQTFWLNRSQLADYFEHGIFPTPPSFERKEESASTSGGTDEAYSLDSESIANYFMDNYGSEFLYLDSVIYHWSGKVWDEDNARRVRDKYIIRSMKQVVLLLEDSMDFDGDGKYNINATGIKSVAYILNSDGFIPRVKFRDFKTDIYTINLNNGIFNFKTGKLEPHDKARNWTSIIDVDYKPEIDNGEWLTAYDQITLPVKKTKETFNLYLNQQSILQMALGVAMIGKQNEHLFHLYGDGGSGKGTLLNTILTVLGEDMSQPIQENTLMKPQQGQAFELYQLKNCIMAFCDDVEAGKLTKSNIIKGLTGGGRLSTAKKGHEGFSFNVKFDLWVTSEDLLSASATDEGFYRRIRMFHMPNGEQARGVSDGRFKEKWANILPQDQEGQNRRSMVLKWLIDGVMRYMKNHHGTLPLTELQKQKIEELKSENDTITDWLAHAINTKDLILQEKAFTPNKDLYQQYKLYCELKRWKPETAQMFSKELGKNSLAKESGIKRSEKRIKKQRGFVGCLLIDEVHANIL